ncbi:hypothetical protein SARI_03227 [Salmonella enterica subsp. arizonae serovar 62:z4,z23:-]|uniref:Uncharacterized protein n=1 Tax=Salmonella arizonae (strain ATCC BAA-731 / CDC346-86 / RSK2980) TaxID=41514 RepID=A9MEZ7_SALAR|nr:hypothetical protein SARI_03227 [Salmonella enterica subsp. arizonae serovar 62:z4,z23:-]
MKPDIGLTIDLAGEGGTAPSDRFFAIVHRTVNHAMKRIIKTADSITVVGTLNDRV